MRCLWVCPEHAPPVAVLAFLTHYAPARSPCLPAVRPTPQVFQKNHGIAWWSVIKSVCAMSACLYLISISPWYMLPFAWALAGTAFTGVSHAMCTCGGVGLSLQCMWG